jgi:hypothetical protein
MNLSAAIRDFNLTAGGSIIVEIGNWAVERQGLSYRNDANGDFWAVFDDSNEGGDQGKCSPAFEANRNRVENLTSQTGFAMLLPQPKSGGLCWTRGNQCSGVPGRGERRRELPGSLSRPSPSANLVGD